ncbi:hypothetical protein COOONC_17561 [Cooperia oncophora]
MTSDSSLTRLDGPSSVEATPDVVEEHIRCTQDWGAIEATNTQRVRSHLGIHIQSLLEIIQEECRNRDWLIEYARLAERQVMRKRNYGYDLSTATVAN